LNPDPRKCPSPLFSGPLRLTIDSMGIHDCGSYPGANRILLLLAVSFLFALPSGCATQGGAMQGADEAAARIITSKQIEALGSTEPFTVLRSGGGQARNL